MSNNEYPRKKLTPEEEEYWKKRSAKTPAKSSRKAEDKRGLGESMVDFLTGLLGL